MILRSNPFSDSDQLALYVSVLLLFVRLPWRQRLPTYLQIKKPRLDKLLSAKHSLCCLLLHSK